MFFKSHLVFTRHFVNILSIFLLFTDREDQERQLERAQESAQERQQERAQERIGLW